VELGPTFNLPSTCIIISNAGTLRYSTLRTFIDGHEAIFRLNAGPPQTRSDVRAGTSVRIINKQLKAVDFEDDIILQWKPGRRSNLAKDTAPACRPGGGTDIIPPSTQWTVWTYLQKWAAEEIHPHPPTTGFLTFFIVSHFCPMVTLVHFHM
jgi:beta-galactoside alpha-2,6-sialyltransferase (sialyltransferase 1)